MSYSIINSTGVILIFFMISVSCVLSLSFTRDILTFFIISVFCVLSLSYTRDILTFLIISVSCILILFTSYPSPPCNRMINWYCRGTQAKIAQLFAHFTLLTRSICGLAAISHILKGSVLVPRDRGLSKMPEVLARQRL